MPFQKGGVTLVFLLFHFGIIISKDQTNVKKNSRRIFTNNKPKEIMDFEYPYQDTVNEILEGEIWKDLPGFEGLYQVSSLGRIKSLTRYSINKAGKRKLLKGRLMKQRKFCPLNKSINGPGIAELRIALSKDGVEYYFIIKRLIYSAFFPSFDYKNSSIPILNIDCDGLNCRIENLRMSTLSEKHVRMFERDRCLNYFKGADRSKWKKPYGGICRSKGVYQMKGDSVVARFNSVREASRQTSTDLKSIIGALKGRYKQLKGYNWSYADFEPAKIEHVNV